MPKTHPEVLFDSALIDQIAARLDLRIPNKEALEAVALELSETGGKSWFGICDLATAVGKTYLAAAFIDYLALSEAQVRNFLFVVPNKTVFRKTIDNFSPANRRSLLGGMAVQPVVIHPENFNAGWVAAELENPDSVKLFIFNIQQLIEPTGDLRRRTRDDDNENLGASLYTLLCEQKDLVVLSDEHHMYAPKAEVYSATINALDAMAVIGLTATPDAEQRDAVVYNYPLARAIADRLVKTPCITGRSDNRHDRETRFRDALVLLEAKKIAADQYAASTGQRTVNPVLLVVAESIEQADEVGDRLRQDDMFGDDGSVLVVHSNSDEVDLDRLAEVEDPDSPVRVIVSVQMLGVGWDVKNVYVILSLRPSVSEALTEQTLGRGLRLPWGQYTESEMLDTVEVLAHEQYKKLLEQTDRILEGLTREGKIDSKKAEAARKRAAAKRAAQEAEAQRDLAAAETQPGDEPTKGSADDPSTVEPLADAPQGASETGESADNPSEFFHLKDVEERKSEATQAAESIDSNKVIEPRSDCAVRLPVVTSEAKPKTLNLTEMKSDQFQRYGQQIGSGEAAALLREILNVKENPDGKYTLASKPGQLSLAAAQPTLPSGSVQDEIVTAILGSEFVPSTAQNVSAANRLAKAMIEGAGDETRLVAELPAAIDIALGGIREFYNNLEPEFTNTVRMEDFKPIRANYRPVVTNRFADFSRSDAYSGWSKGLYPIAWFDSEPERACANILEGDDQVDVWVRLERGDTPVSWNAGVYQPDFYVKSTDGKNWMVEVKADKDLPLETVQRKKNAAEIWVNLVSDSGFGDWRYALIPESTVKNVNTFRQMCKGKR